MKKIFKMLMLMLLSVSLLTGCSNSNDNEIIGDIVKNDIIIRDNELVDVCITSDKESIYFYLDDDSHELLDTATLPMKDYTDNWRISDINLKDITGNHYSDLCVDIVHEDDSETRLIYVWNENDHFLFQEFYSYFTKTPEIVDDSSPDFSEYAGTWVSTEDNMYEGIYIKIDLEGNWELYSGDELVDEGYLYVIEGDGTFIYSYEVGALNGGKVEKDGESLYIDTAGYFIYTNEIDG